ncbi:hypothetical protein NE237_031856 [Protea cynaroides]|uniref:EamA domain-containing protein n=1 Tax=Protea cynaroides TaxID=273540 RepID=A0A9Q0L293_9MAGN|nr:hypothetical protein NE237_031856 [Protea cynaroides]
MGRTERSSDPEKKKKELGYRRYSAGVTMQYSVEVTEAIFNTIVGKHSFYIQWQEIFLSKLGSVKEFSIFTDSSMVDNGSDSAPELVMQLPAILFRQFGFAGSHVVSKGALNTGSSKIVFLIFKNIIVLPLFILLAYFQRENTPRLTTSFIADIFNLAFVGITATEGLYLMGLDSTSPTVASALQNSISAITILIRDTYRQKIDRPNGEAFKAKMTGTLLCVAGALVITLYKGPTIFSLAASRVQEPHLFLSQGDATGKIWILGLICLIGHCFFSSIWYVNESFVVEKYGSRLYVTFYTCIFGVLQFFVIAVVAAFMGLNSEARPIQFLSTKCFSVLYMAVVVSGTVFAVKIWRIKTGNPLSEAKYQPVQTLFVALMDSITLGEQFYLGGFIGAALCIIGLYVVLWGEKQHTQFLRDLYAEPSVRQLQLV